MEFIQLEYFKEVALTGSVTKAAENLHMTQPALSRSIARLEKEIGAPLFDRRCRRLELNTYGRMFLGTAELALGQLEAEVENIRGLYRRENSVLSLACSAEDFLADMLIGFSAKYPDIGIRQYRHADEDMEKYLLSQSIEVGLSMNRLDSDKLAGEVISRSEYVLVCSKRRGLPETVSLSALRDEGFICDESRLDGKKLTEICSGIGFLPRITHEAEHAKLLYELLCADAGLMVLPRPAFYTLCARYGGGEISMHTIGERLPEAEVHVFWLRGHALSQSAVLFVDYIREVMSREAKVI